MYLILGNFQQILKFFDSKIKKLGAVFSNLFCTIHVLHRERPPRRRDFNLNIIIIFHEGGGGGPPANTFLKTIKFLKSLNFFNPVRIFLNFYIVCHEITQGGALNIFF